MKWNENHIKHRKKMSTNATHATRDGTLYMDTSSGVTDFQTYRYTQTHVLHR